MLRCTLPSIMNRFSPRAIVFLGVFFTSFSSIFVRSSTAPSLIIATYRMWFSVLLLLPLYFIEKRNEKKNPTSTGARSIRLTDIGLSVLSGLFLAIHFATWFASLKLISIAGATVLVNTQPLFVLAAGFFLYRERVRPLALLFVALTLVGIVILSVGDISQGGGSFTGVLLALLGAATVSGYLLIGRSVRKRLPAIRYVLIVYGVSAVSLTLVCLLGSIPLVGYPLKEYGIFLAMALFCTLLGHTVFNWALGYLKTSAISMIVLSEPVYATLLGIIIFKEIPASITMVGSVVVILGVLLFIREEAKMTQSNTFDEKAKNWDVNPMQIERSRAISAAMARILPLNDSMTALDYGAGTGLLALALSTKLKSVLAMDSSKGMLEVLSKKLSADTPNLSVVNHDLCTTNYTGDPFDLVYTAMTLHHVDDVESLLSRFATLVKPGGYLAIADLETEDGSFHGGELHTGHHGFDPAQLATRVEAIGFGAVSYEQIYTVDREGATYPVFLLTGRKK